ncbi:glycosyltransferase family 4 protein [Robiginitalea aurantiaca]|uniref:Glycosyltransferase family 4 protein n=1 Tax=Robiginitalea aurantiaca TaxID=3056915 RepID=A0ABT7WAF1_9FLAO|nr:glycosyltransferase family 4 protein [Robiginitalea aurantiaca]MDM9629900.1 glycosyltransferase family 4 protein [Robiginitalea aurantiaca]
MRILLLSNMYPSKEKPYAGIFVKNQFEEIGNQMRKDEQVDIFYMPRRFTGKLGTILKYIRAFFLFIPFIFRKYDLIHLHFFYPLIYLVWIYKKIHPNATAVVTFHGKDITVAVTEKNKKHLKKLAESVDFAIPVGKTLASMVQAKLHLETGMVLPVGVDDRIFRPEENVEKCYDFVWIGSFIHRKGIDLLIQAIRQLDRDDVTFCFCGSGEYIEELQDLAKSYPISIKQNLTQPEISRLLNQARFFVLMSRNEGFPTATIEAMYCGIPVLTSDIPQFLEQVNPGVNGYTTPLGDVAAVAEKLGALKDLSDSEYSKLSKGALKSFRELSLQNVCSQLLNAYRKLAK